MEAEEWMVTKLLFFQPPFFGTTGLYSHDYYSTTGLEALERTPKFLA